MSGFVRTYLYKLDREVNAGKLRSLQALHAEWQRCLPLSSTRTIGCANKAWQYALAHKKRSGEGALEKRQRETDRLYISDTLSKVEKAQLFKTIEQAISASSTT